MEILEIAAKMSGFSCRFCKGSLMKVHYLKLYNMAHLLALNVLLLPKDLTIIFISHHYHLDESIVIFRGIRNDFKFLFSFFFQSNSFKQTE